MQPPGRQVVHQGLDAADVVPVHIDPQADIDAVLKSQRHVFQNAVIGRYAVPVEAAPVIQLAHTVHRNLQLVEFELLQQPDIGVQVIAIGDGGELQPHVPGMLADVPHCLHVLFEQRLATVKGTVSYFVALVTLFLERSKDGLHHLRLHFMAQPLLSTGQTVPLKAVRAAEIAIVGRQDHRSPAALTNQFAPDAPQQLCVSQFPGFVLPGDMAPQRKPLPQGKRNRCKIALADLCRRRLVDHVDGAVQSVH